MSSPAVPVTRVGGRVLLRDPAGRVLLIHERIDDGSTHWLTPGGGVEGGEHPRDAAVREAYEETGLRIELAADAPAVHVTRRLWSWAGVVYDQTDHFFLVDVAADPALRPAHLTEMERQTAIGFGWWTREQLLATDEVLLPPDLGELLGRLSTTR